MKKDKKSPFYGMTTYQKITKVMGEVLFLILPIYAIFYVLNEFFCGKRCFILTAILVSLFLWMLGEIIDMARDKYGRRKKKR